LIAHTGTAAARVRFGGHHEAAANVLAGEQRQGAHLGDGLSRAVGVQRAHPGKSAESARAMRPAGLSPEAVATPTETVTRRRRSALKQ